MVSSPLLDPRSSPAERVELAISTARMAVRYMVGVPPKVDVAVRCAQRIVWLLDGLVEQRYGGPVLAGQTTAEARAQARPPDPRLVREAQEIASRHGFELRDLCVRVRQRHLMQVRREVARTLRVQGATLADIGSVLCRDHTTVRAMLSNVRGIDCGCK